MNLEQETTLAGVLSGAAQIAEADIAGAIEVNAGGTFGLRFAQNAETGGAESVVMLRGSWLKAEVIP